MLRIGSFVDMQMTRPCEAVDVHHIIVRKSGAKGLFVYLFAVVILATAFYVFFVKEKSAIIVLWSLLLDAFLVKLLQKSVEKGEDPSDGAFESIMVMPAFGVQLETHYVRYLLSLFVLCVLSLLTKSSVRIYPFYHCSGKIIRRFVPMDKILKPVVLECVTPVTCYWSLSFIVHGEAELVLVFKELRPPMKMLVPIWKALCAATGTKGSSNACTEDASVANQVTRRMKGEDFDIYKIKRNSFCSQLRRSHCTIC
ncbi:hypothetical protein DVH24_018376 [Malus domestica]|uniref:Phosphatidylinositol N-acetylglucosaminyltransferase subunit H conserved domain-containing protein n=1 Tax=Malus domestica TaxID=3750 RepID=A0A498KIV2_MALDO|nr:hypothetical protein DVH24_018376 [Malus domestica]